MPASFDLRNRNGKRYIGFPRDQASCGACYAFAACASAESTYNWAMEHNDKGCVNYSESFIIWCLAGLPQYINHFWGCLGADYEYKELEALVNYGTCSEEDFPYTTSPCMCAYWGVPLTNFSAWYRIGCGDSDTIKAAIMTYGAVDAAVYVTDAFLLYSGGIFTDSQTTCPYGYYTGTNHAVALVGWGYDDTYGEYWSFSPSGYLSGTF